MLMIPPWLFCSATALSAKAPNANPAEELSAAIAKAKEIAASEGRYISAICSIVGTEGDPQNLTETRKQLEAAGAIVVRSNAQSTYLVHHMLDKLNGGKY